MKYIRPLEIRIFWDSQFEKGIDFANLIYQNFMRNEDIAVDYNLNIPVYYINSPNNNPYNYQSKVVVCFIFIDDNLIINKDSWLKTFEDLMQLSNKGNVHIIPIKFSDNAFEAFDGFSHINFIINEDKTKFDKLLLAVAYSTYSILFNSDETSKVDIPLFLSHSKMSKGADVARNIINYIKDNKSPIKVFFDENDIKYGERFDIIIDENIKKSTLIVLHTDGFSSREFCRREILSAKKYGRPIVLVDFLEQGENRSFPYLGNTKTIKVEKNVNYFKLIFEVLKESIRLEYFRRKNESIVSFFKSGSEKTTVIAYPPELLTMSFSGEKREIIIYPNPVLGNEELQILKSQFPLKTFLTPILFVTSTKNYKDMLNGISISFSISETDEIISSQDALLRSQEMLVNISRYLIASGAKLVYSGNINYHKFNFLDILINQFHTYKDWIEDKKGITTSFFEYFHLKGDSTSLTKTKLASIANIGQITNVEPITDYNSNDINRAFSLSNIRELVSQKVSGSIFIGGKVDNYSGVMPGVLEEFIKAFKNNKIIFLIGAFGGITYEIINLIIKKSKSSLISNEFLKSRKKLFYDEYDNIQNLNKRDKVDFDKIASEISKINISSLNNGLSEEENLDLFYSDDPDLVSSLILKGLSKKTKQINMKKTNV